MPCVTGISVDEFPDLFMMPIFRMLSAFKNPNDPGMRLNDMKSRISGVRAPLH